MDRIVASGMLDTHSNVPAVGGMHPLRPIINAEEAAKRNLSAGEMLDGEGGYTVYGKLFAAQESLQLGGLPLGLAHDVKLLNPIPAGQPVRWTDVQYDAASDAVKIRREMEREFAPAQRAAA